MRKSNKGTAEVSQKIKYLRDSQKHRVALLEGARALVIDAMKLSMLTGSKI